MLQTYFDKDTLKQATILSRNYEPVHHFWEPQLTTQVASNNRLHITIPLDCIENPTGEIDLMVQTVSMEALVVPYDNLPDRGVVTLPTKSGHGTTTSSAATGDDKTDNSSATSGAAKKSILLLSLWASFAAGVV